MRSYGETRCIDQQKPKTKIEIKDAKEYKAIYCMTCWTGCRISDKIWSMKAVLKSHGDPSPGHRHTSSSSLQFPMESRAKVAPGSGEHSVYTHFPKDPNCEICLKTEITRASCRRRAGTVVPRAENFGDLITAETQNSH